MDNDAQKPKGKTEISNKKNKKFVIVGILIVIAISISLIAYNNNANSTVYKIPTTSNSVPHDSMGMMHIHPHLTLTIDGKPATVPANIGIDSQLWNMHSLDTYGMTGMAP